METAAELVGVVLAGGQSRRMGSDKGSLRYQGQPLVRRAYRLLEGFFPNVYVSLNARQATLEPYRGLPQLIDDGRLSGPVAGLIAGWSAHPNAALCVLAADMPWVNKLIVEQLLEAREPTAIATAFVHPDGVPEPLCTIWEPAAREAMPDEPGPGGISLRWLLRQGRAQLIAATDHERLASVNSPEDLHRLLTT